MTKISNPVPIFLDSSGNPADGGYIYIGQANTDPEQSPITVYWDKAMTIVAAQPLRTSGGLIVNGATPANVYCAAADYSLRLRDITQAQVFYTSSAAVDLSGLQPKDSDLTAIANQGTTPFGISLLLLANQTALQNVVGLPPALPLAGGAMQGNVTRQGAGAYPYFVDSGITVGRIFIAATSAGDPSSQPGDIVLQY